MPKVLYREFILVVTLGLAGAVSGAWAAGSGGGGSGACVNDTWYCSAWSTCSAAGNQSRTCSLLSDCPNADDPRPTETQPCLPPCTEDSWACGGWSACISGTPADGGASQTRTCTLEVDCPAATTPQPATSQACTPPPSAPPTPATVPLTRPTPSPKPQVRSTPTPSPSPIGPLCHDRDTIAARVRCRLQLPPPELENQQALRYLPEECRAIGDRVAGQQCVDLYRELQGCWKFPVGRTRIDCVKKIIKLGDLTNEAAACEQLPQNEIADCWNTLRSRVYSLIKFRFYDLEERAEELLERGASLETVVTFIAAVETAKQKFNLATTKDQRRTVILEVRTRWQTFAKLVSPALR